MSTFMESLKVMGLGMAGIFAVAIALMLIMMALTRFFPADKKGGDDTETPEDQ